MAYNSSDVFSITPYIKSDAPLTREEYKKEVLLRLAKVLPEFDLNECFDADFKCEETDALTDRVKEFLAKYDYDISLVKDAEILEEMVLEGITYKLIFVDCDEKLDGANLTILSLNDRWFLPSNNGAYPLCLENARMYKWADDKILFILTANYGMVKLNSPETTLCYARLEYLNNRGFNGHNFDGVILLYGHPNLTFLDNVCQNNKYIAYYKNDEDIEPYKVEEIRLL